MKTRAQLVAIASAFFTFFACSDDETTVTPEPADVGFDEGEVGSDAVDGPENDAEDDTIEQEDAADVADLADLGDVIENTFAPIDRTEPIPGLEPEGHPDVISALSEGEVRAGIIVGPETTFGGIETDCRPGDFKIYNELVQFCIAGPTPINLWLYSGGTVVDADRVGEMNDRFFITAAQNHVGVPGADTVEVIADGRDGMAVIRVVGPEEPLRVATEAVGLIFPLRGVSFETEYRLRPGQLYLEMVTWVRADSGIELAAMGDLAAFGDTTSVFFPGFGRDRPAIDQPFQFVAATADGRSYALYATDGYSQFHVDISELYPGNPYLLMVSNWGTIPPDEEGGYRRYFIVDDGGTDGIRRAIAEIEGEELPNQAIIVTAEEHGVAQQGVSVVLRNDEGMPTDVLYTDADGEARIETESGDYSLQVEGWAGGALEPIEISVSEGNDVEVPIELPVTATLVVNIEAIEYGEDEPSPSPGKVRMGGSESYLFFSHDGILTEQVRPGTYRIEVTRGEEFTANVFEGVVLTSDEATELNVQIERVWDTDGLVSGDFHQHCTRSPDSFVTEIDRVLSNVVEGVDFIVPSDHEAVTDFWPQIIELGVEELVYTMPSSEVSPVFTHLNPMPMPYDPLLPAGGGYSKGVFEDGYVSLLSFPEIVADLRANFGVQVVQINHPRGGGAALFDYAGYDPLEGPDSANPARFVMDFDSVEVFNSRNEFCQIFTDWLGFIAHGYHVTGVGNSDTHSRGGPPGYPRNYLPSDATTAADITDEDIIDALLVGNLSVSGGALITFPDGPELGSLLDVSAEPTFDLPILVQTPIWSTVERVQIIVGGDVVGDIEIDEAAEQVRVLEDTLTLNRPLTDNYLVVVAFGNGAMPLDNTGQRPFGFTNPLYLDVDGDDAWTPPGVETADDLVFLDIPWCR